MKAAHQPYMKWYPTDWRADPALRMCSLAARGLWIELIGYMHEGEPYGYLTINGSTPSIADLAALVGRPAAEVRKAMGELEQRQVFSRDEAGPIYSRRMVRDKAKAEQDRANGKGGGNPKLKGGVNPPDKAQIPEARDQRPEREISADAGGTRYVFESGVIRLNERDFQQWAISYGHLELRAELLHLSEWAATLGPKRWFHAVQKALANKNREVKAKKDQLAEQGGFKWNGGIEGVI